MSKPDQAAHRSVMGKRHRWILAAALAAGCVSMTASAQMTPAQSLKTFKMADGLAASMFATEPMVLNPTDIDVDYKGRVWVCEGVNYRSHEGLRPAGDRIVVLEDTDGDGVADKQTTFYQGNDVNAALGICVLGNQVIVSCSPNVFLFTDTNGDLKADKKQILFSGLSGHQHDHGVHAFVFGPDGKLYFNFGNEGHQVKGPDGRDIVDLAGNVVSINGKRSSEPSRSGPYRMGMVFRCNPDGSDFETLAWNFRNNYEVNVDSFGTMWQSDNDDDGNRGVCINYVMEFGNYGYADEMTGAGWGTKRTNMSPEIPLRHWHQNDPGVVPNLLQTGAGSPTGICVYEGSLLPQRFHDQMIHADAGPNVVRAYPVTVDGAGYKATIDNIIHGGDRWFRPSDVCVAPDGSLMVADWYDPGVGGHAMGDNKWGSIRGRIIRVAPPGEAYHVPVYDFNSVAGDIEALKSPNMSARQMAWVRLHAMGTAAEPALQKLWHDANPRFRARALWLLGKIDGKAQQYVNQAIHDADPDIRITGIRLARQQKLELIPVVKTLVNDPSAGVRRECAIALRHSRASEAAELWAQLALQHDGRDRWYLEALGIGADRNETSYLAAYLARVGEHINTPAARDIIWRSRGDQTPALLAKLIADPSTPVAEHPRLMRAFDFQPQSEARTAALLSLLTVHSSDRNFLLSEALVRLKASGQVAGLRDRINQALDAARGTPEAFVDLVEQLGVRDRDDQVMAVAVEKPADPAAATAVRILLNHGNLGLIEKTLTGKEGQNLAVALGSSTDRKVMDMLVPMVIDGKRDLEARKAIVGALGRSQAGGIALVRLVKADKIPLELSPTVSKVLHNSISQVVRDQAKVLFPLPPTKDGKPLPTIAQLLTMKGNPAHGHAVWQANSCIQCHQIGSEGTNFGPALTEIGDKWGKDGLYTAILYPSAGIEHNYTGHVIKVKGGDELVGIVEGETADTLQLRIAGGIVQPIPRKKILKDRTMKESIMPEELQKGMTVQDLVDLVDYLSTLRKAR